MGRTGSFIAIDIILEQVEKQKRVDVSGVINKMRHQRMKMVQTAVSNVAIIHSHQFLEIDILAKTLIQVPKFRLIKFIPCQLDNNSDVNFSLATD